MSVLPLSPMVAALMLTHNYCPYLQQGISSVRAQNLPVWELLIGEDGVTEQQRQHCLPSRRR